MRILVHDFVGHAFPIQLSRALAARGHLVTHAHSIGFQGPKGKLANVETDPESLKIVGINLSKTFKKYSTFNRFFAQRRYARQIKSLLAREKFDVILSGQTPIDIQAEILYYCKRTSIGFVHWVQDLYSVAIDFFLRRKIRILASPLAFPFRKLEQIVASASNATVVIAPSFRDFLIKLGTPAGNISVLQNWGPIDEINVLPRDNPWARKHETVGSIVFLYSGTLGLKHRPDLIYRLAETLPKNHKVIVVSEGTGREFLKNKPYLSNLVLLDYQPYDRLSEVLASADVLLATLEADASTFAIPSKILTYLCARRPLLFAAPSTNLSAQVLATSGGGISVEPEQEQAWLSAAKLLASDPALRESLSASGRNFAEKTFDINKIADEFQAILFKAYASAQANSLSNTPVPETRPGS